MSVISLLAVFLFYMTHASAGDSTVTSCSSSDGAIKWQEGSAHEGVLLRYSNFVEGTLELEREEVNIELSNLITFKEEHFKNEKIRARKKVIVARAMITASEKFPDVLRSQFPENKVVGEVICTNVILRQKY